MNISFQLLLYIVKIKSQEKILHDQLSANMVVNPIFIYYATSFGSMTDGGEAAHASVITVT